MKIQENIYNLANCELFNGLDDNELDLLFKDLHYQIKNIEKEQYIAYQNTRCNDLLILLKGKVSAEITDFRKNKIQVSEIFAISSIATAFLFGQKSFFPINIVAKEDVVLLKIPKESVLKMLDRNFKFSLNLLDSISGRTQYLMRKMKFLSFQTIKEKLAFFLLKKSDEKKSDTIYIELSQTKLSELFGVARQSLARTIKEISDDGIIKKDKNKITILNREALCKMVKK